MPAQARAKESAHGTAATLMAFSKCSMCKATHTIAGNPVGLVDGKCWACRDRLKYVKKANSLMRSRKAKSNSGTRKARAHKKRRTARKRK